MTSQMPPGLSAAERIVRVHDALHENGLSFTEFLDGYLSSSVERVRRSTSNWARYTDSRSYGPLRLVQAVAALVDRVAPREGFDALASGLLRLAIPSIERELHAARRVPDFRSARTLEESELAQHDQIKVLQRSIAHHLPVTQELVAALIPHDRAADGYDTSDSEGGSSMDSEGVDEDAQSTQDLRGSSGEQTSKIRRAQVVIVSIVLMTRSRRMNRLQSLIGCMLRFFHGPKSIQTLLNHLSLSTSRGASIKHLASISSRAKARSVDIMKDHPRVKVLLFDNIDIYLRVLPERLTASSHLVNLTSRTLLRLPPSFQAAAISQAKLRPLRNSRALELQHVSGDPAFLERAVKLQVAKELARMVSVAQTAT